LKILLAHCFFQQFGGQDSVALSEREMLEAHGHQVIPYLRHNDEIRSFGTLEKVTFLGDTIYSRRTVREVQALVASSRPDVAYIHNVYPLISPAIYHCLHALGIPIVQCVHDFRPLCANGLFYRQHQCCELCKGGNHLHGFVNKCYKDSYFLSGLYSATLFANREAGMMKKISAYLCLNQFYQDKLLEVGVPAGKVYVRPNSIDAFVSAPSAPAESPAYALFLGRLSPEKGLWTLVHAFETIPSAQLKIVGTGPMEAELAGYIREKGLQNIKMMGFRAGNEKSEFLRGALFSIIPSEWHENFPVVALESFAAAKPIVAARMGGLPSIVADGETGLLFTAGDSAELGSKASYMFANPLEALRMGSRASELAQTKYSREASYRNLMEVFQKVMAA
jgi:glycosyltransferase involved in cell wall biosynthesis